MEDPYPAENIDRLGVLMFQTSDNSQLLRRVLWINAELTIVSSLKHKNTQPIYIFNRENPQNSELQNGLRRGLDFIALPVSKSLVDQILLIPFIKLFQHPTGSGPLKLSTSNSSSRIASRVLFSFYKRTHHMFSQILYLRIYGFFSRNFHCFLFLRSAKSFFLFRINSCIFVFNGINQNILPHRRKQ